MYPVSMFYYPLKFIFSKCGTPISFTTRKVSKYGVISGPNSVRMRENMEKSHSMSVTNKKQ